MIRFASSLRPAMLGVMLATSTLASAQTSDASGAAAPAPFTSLDRASVAALRFSAAERGQPIMAGERAAVTGEGFRPGQRVQLSHGNRPIDGGALVAGADGTVAGTIAVPADAAPGIHPIVVVAEAPYTALIAELKVSPSIPLSGQQAFDVAEAVAVRGLYQSAYSPKHHALFVTAAVGRPPVRQSELLRLDPDTLRITARTTPAAAPASQRSGGEPGVFAVYGVGIDDAHDRLWVTNTRQDTAAVYRQGDLALVKQFEPGTVPHARDAVIDQRLNKAYVGATGTPEIVVFDTDGLNQVGRINIRSAQAGEGFNVGSLSLDQANHRLYAVSMSTNEVAVIDTRTDEVRNVFAVPGARSAIGVSHDPQTGRIYVASQGSDNLVVLDGSDGRVIADTLVGAGALNVVFDPATRHAYVASRGAGTITVTDADGRIVANLGPAPLANHVALGKDGTIWAVDKSGGPLEAEGDRVLRIRQRR